MMRQLTLGVLGSFLFAALVAACGSTIDSIPDCGDFAACEPACPAPLAIGGQCSLLGQRCGTTDECGDAQMATCTTSGWQLSPNPNPPECPCNSTCTQPACPAAQPQQGDACYGPSQTCEYASPSCNEAGATAVCTNGTWEVSEYGPSCIQMCPTSLPTAGTPCDGCCLASGCTFLDESGCPALLACSHGVWEVSPSDCVPTSPCASKGMGECTNAQGCRWMVQAGCPTTFQIFTQGCYPAADCATNADCTAGTTCKEAEVDPCPAGDCNACSEIVHLCLP